MKDHVLLVTVDSLRVDHLGCYGYSRDTSPNIDELAFSSHIFNDAFAHGCATQVSFPAILTSSYPMMYGGIEYVSPSRTLLSEVLSEGGFETAGFHSNPFLSAGFGYERGFDKFFDGTETMSASARIRQLVRNRLDHKGALFQTLKRLFDATEKKVGVEVGSAYVAADDITDEAIEWVAETDPSSPTFLWVHYMDVHHPYVPPAEHQLAVCDSAVGYREAIRLRQKMLEAPDDITETEFDDILDLYDAEIRYTDAEIGRLLSEVSDVWDDPLVVFTADHGEEFLEHGAFSHGSYYDEGVHVPLVLDDGTAGGTHDDLIGLLDVAPTIVDYTGSDVPDNFYGYSLRRLIEGEEWPRRSVIGGWGEPDPDGYNVFYRDERWKYIRRADEEELYDLDADPGEQENVVGEEPQITGRVRDAVGDHERSIQATHENLAHHEVTDGVQERLEMLGYTE